MVTRAARPAPPPSHKFARAYWRGGGGKEINKSLSRIKIKYSQKSIMMPAILDSKKQRHTYQLRRTTPINISAGYVYLVLGQHTRGAWKVVRIGMVCTQLQGRVVWLVSRGRAWQSGWDRGGGRQRQGRGTPSSGPGGTGGGRGKGAEHCWRSLGSRKSFCALFLGKVLACN